METMTLKEFRLLLRRAGLALPQDEMERLKPLFEAFRERLKVLYAADLDNEEVSGIFVP